MANRNKYVVRVVALVEVEAGSEGDARTMGGNLARQVAGSIPVQYNTLGVEVEGVSDGGDEGDSGGDGGKEAKASTTTTRTSRNKANDGSDETTLTT